ncbi:MAG: hypothetical protein AAFX41_14240 [Bacteroidota bacterium]
MLTLPFPSPHFRLALTLESGREVIARPVLPTDRERLRRGFDALSDRSKLLRFFAPHPTLTEAELRYLTDVDHVHHAAWGLLSSEGENSKTIPGIGIGRFVRLPQTPDAAEFSLTVADGDQGSGAGRLLLALLLVHARRVDIRSLMGLVEDGNTTVQGWMRRLGLGPRRSPDGLLYSLPTEYSAWKTSSASSANALAQAVAQVDTAWNRAVAHQEVQPQNDV